MEVVVVLGASSDTTRYSYKALEMLEQYGHQSIPVHPRETLIRGQRVVHQLKDLTGERVDTVTVYVNSEISSQYKDDLIALKPKRVIFNPGAENLKLSNELEKNGIRVENACTLVLLRTGSF